MDKEPETTPSINEVESTKKVIVHEGNTLTKNLCECSPNTKDFAFIVMYLFNLFG